MTVASAPVPIAPILIAVAGVGKIARDQHLPAIAVSSAFELAGVVSAHAEDLGVPAFATIEALAAALPEVRAVAICTPPIERRALIAAAFDAGLHVLIEKPPATTLAEAESFAPLAMAAGRGFYATWHAREAPAVAPARAWLAGKRVRRAEIHWLEDVRVWHPGQQWIWSPGIGVFDPGINALSIATHLLPAPFAVQEAVLHFPENRDAPIAAELALAVGNGAPVDVHFSFDQQGPQRWDIRVETDQGVLDLVEGGNRLLIDGQPVPIPHLPEYHRIYARFADLVSRAGIDADMAPFRLVADAFLLGTQPWRPSSTRFRRKTKNGWQHGGRQASAAVARVVRQPGQLGPDRDLYRALPALRTELERASVGPPGDRDRSVGRRFGAVQPSPSGAGRARQGGIRDAGGIPIEFLTHPLQETGKRSTAGLHRNLAYLDLVEILYGYPLDGVVLTIGCDKTTPAALMAAATVNIPATALSVGPMLSGWHEGERIGSGTIIWKARELLSQGKIDYRGFIALAAQSAPSTGYCNTMGTATTMNSLTEALGMSLPRGRRRSPRRTATGRNAPGRPVRRSSSWCVRTASLPTS